MGKETNYKRACPHVYKVRVSYQEQVFEQEEIVVGRLVCWLEVEVWKLVEQHMY